MKTVAEIISYVDNVVANAMATTDKYVFLSEIIQDVREYNTIQGSADTNTDTNTSIYGLPSGVNYQDLQQVLINNTTYSASNGSSNLNASTNVWIASMYKGFDDSETGNYQYNEISSSQIVLHNLSTVNKLHLRYVYIPCLSFATTTSTDSTTILEMDDCITSYVQNKLAAKVCRSGPFPHITLGNNYELEAAEWLTKVKLNKRKNDVFRSKRKISYKGWW